MGGKKNRTKWRKLSLGGEPSAEDAALSTPGAADYEPHDHDSCQEEEEFDDVSQYNGDYSSNNILSLVHDSSNGEGPPTLVFPNLGPLPIVGFAPHPPPPAGPPLSLPVPHPPSDINGEPDGNHPDGGVYVNGLWIPQSELYKQYGGRSPPCLVYHPIPWVRVRSAGHPPHHTHRGSHRGGRGIVPSDAHYRVYFTRRPPPMPPHRGSWRSTQRAHQSHSPYHWCLGPPPQPFDNEATVQQQQSEMPPPDGEESQTTPCQPSSPYVYPGYSFGPPVFTAPVLPVQSSSASKILRPATPPPPPPVTSEVASPPDAPTVKSPKKKKKRRSKPRDAMDCPSNVIASEIPLTEKASDITSTAMALQAPEQLLRFVEDFMSTTLSEAKQQFKQLRQERLVNGYADEVLAQFQQHTRSLARTPPDVGSAAIVMPNTKATQLKTPTKHERKIGEIAEGSTIQSAMADVVTNDITLVPCVLSNSQNCNSICNGPVNSVVPLTPNTQTVSIVFTSDEEPVGTMEKSSTVEAFSYKVAESILRDLTETPESPHVVASRSQLFLEGLENNYPSSSAKHIEHFSAQFVEVVIREVYQKLGVVASSDSNDSQVRDKGLLDSGVVLEGFAEELLENIFRSAKEEFSVKQNTLSVGNRLPPSEAPLVSSSTEDSAIFLSNHLSNSVPHKAVAINEENENKATKSKALVHFLEQGFHAPSFETFDDHFPEDELDDYVSRERYMECDPALSHLNLLNQSESLLTDTEQELNQLQNRVKQLTDQSIYKISYDEISYTDQSESEDQEHSQDYLNRSSSASEDREPVVHQPMRFLDNHHLRTEIPVYEAETASEAGSEDIELIPHRYESGTTQEKHLYVNRLSLATELLHTNENIPYDDDFKRIIDEEKAAEEGTVNLGFVADENKVVTTRPKAISRISAADSGVQSDESEEELDSLKKTPTKSNQNELRMEDDSDQVEVFTKSDVLNRTPRRPQPSLMQGAPIPPWCSLCCNVQ